MKKQLWRPPNSVFWESLKVMEVMFFYVFQIVFEQYKNVNSNHKVLL